MTRHRRLRGREWRLYTPASYPRGGAAAAAAAATPAKGQAGSL